MLEYRDCNGIVQVYFDHSRSRIGDYSSSFIRNFYFMTCIYPRRSNLLRGRTQPLLHTWKGSWNPRNLRLGCQSPQKSCIHSWNVLLHRRRLVPILPLPLTKISSEVRQRLEPLFKERVRERFGVEADSLFLAARIIAAVTVDIEVDRRDLEALLSMQLGLWGNSWIFMAPEKAMRFRNDGVTTWPGCSRYPTRRV